MRLRLLIFGVIGAALTAGAPARAQSPAPPTYGVDAWTAYRLGCAKLDSGALEAAIHDLQVALAKRPTERDFAVKLATAQQRAGRFADAANVLRTIRAERPNDSSIQAMHGACLAELEDWAGAIEALAPLETELTIVERRALARALRRTARGTDADEVIERAASRFPNDEALALDAVKLALHRRRFSTALERCDKASRAGCSAAQIECLRGAAFLGMGRAVGDPREIPGNAAIGSMLAEGLVIGTSAQPGRVRVAGPGSGIFHTRQAIDAGHHSAEVWATYARCWRAADQKAIAADLIAQHLDEIALLDDAVAIQAVAAIALDASDLAGYLRLIECAASRDEAGSTSMRISAYRTLAERYNLRGDEVMSIAFLQRAHELAPDDIDTTARLGHELFAAGRQAEAGTHYQAVLTADPQHKDRRRILARLSSIIEPRIAASQPAGRP